MNSECFYCNELFESYDLRPYGPNDEMVCAECAMETTPERKQIALDKMNAAIDDIKRKGMPIIITDNGFVTSGIELNKIFEIIRGLDK